jgi:hypothetical protein
MRETRSSGSVEGVMSNRDPYSDCSASLVISTLVCRVTVMDHERVLDDKACTYAAAGPIPQPGP